MPPRRRTSIKKKTNADNADASENKVPLNTSETTASEIDFEHPDKTISQNSNKVHSPSVRKSKSKLSTEPSSQGQNDAMNDELKADNDDIFMLKPEKVNPRKEKSNEKGHKRKKLDIEDDKNTKKDPQVISNDIFTPPPLSAIPPHLLPKMSEKGGLISSSILEKGGLIPVGAKSDETKELPYGESASASLPESNKQKQTIPKTEVKKEESPVLETSNGGKPTLESPHQNSGNIIKEDESEILKPEVKDDNKKTAVVNPPQKPKPSRLINTLAEKDVNAGNAAIPSSSGFPVLSPYDSKTDAQMLLTANMPRPFVSHPIPNAFNIDPPPRPPSPFSSQSSHPFQTPGRFAPSFYDSPMKMPRDSLPIRARSKSRTSPLHPSPSSYPSSSSSPSYSSSIALPPFAPSSSAVNAFASMGVNSTGYNTGIHMDNGPITRQRSTSRKSISSEANRIPQPSNEKPSKETGKDTKLNSDEQKDQNNKNKAKFSFSSFFKNLFEKIEPTSPQQQSQQQPLENVEEKHIESPQPVQPPEDASQPPSKKAHKSVSDWLKVISYILGFILCVWVSVSFTFEAVYRVNIYRSELRLKKGISDASSLDDAASDSVLHSLKAIFPIIKANDSILQFMYFSNETNKLMCKCGEEIIRPCTLVDFVRLPAVFTISTLIPTIWLIVKIIIAILLLPIKLLFMLQPSNILRHLGSNSNLLSKRPSEIDLICTNSSAFGEAAAVVTYEMMQQVASQRVKSVCSELSMPTTSVFAFWRGKEKKTNDPWKSLYQEKGRRASFGKEEVNKSEISVTGIGLRRKHLENLMVKEFGQWITEKCMERKSITKSGAQSSITGSSFGRGKTKAESEKTETVATSSELIPLTLEQMNVLSAAEELLVSPLTSPFFSSLVSHLQQLFPGCSTNPTDTCYVLPHNFIHDKTTDEFMCEIPSSGKALWDLACSSGLSSSAAECKPSLLGFPFPCSVGLYIHTHRLQFALATLLFIAIVVGCVYLLVKLKKRQASHRRVEKMTKLSLALLREQANLSQKERAANRRFSSRDSRYGELSSEQKNEIESALAESGLDMGLFTIHVKQFVLNAMKKNERALLLEKEWKKAEAQIENDARVTTSWKEENGVRGKTWTWNCSFLLGYEDVPSLSALMSGEKKGGKKKGRGGLKRFGISRIWNRAKKGMEELSEEEDADMLNS
ncbi:uncharacterized protein MONOS_3911 [Monocercomonoides exilis]|uniref:uncharacterized protein n=1 Tax=Monocercomonoides exilis TaxID=2049356 RepID=UPI003559E992|nr:hypothetical protein MONOS_3911 [Monocercomonoides exilis]|eukprot:MONOS_3911.1-p1 / transcript=MONOS_3911.1 / gene=MONOS_3911 / organism=Monocercomonoides_exilis_PA203 / gene_product=unspecified product / transcript_product=unspecified product / location=Mono_scaffold00097:17239-21102(-) / protein_length=1185 / sequence_SO=supercontig / SO=protein_coding / is_pseudo=false